MRSTKFLTQTTRSKAVCLTVLQMFLIIEQRSSSSVASISAPYSGCLLGRSDKEVEMARSVQGRAEGWTAGDW